MRWRKYEPKILKYGPQNVHFLRYFNFISLEMITNLFEFTSVLGEEVPLNTMNGNGAGDDHGDQKMKGDIGEAIPISI